MKALCLLLLLAGALTLRADPALDRLLAQAEKEAPAEVELHVIKTSGRLSGFTAKVRETAKVEGWPQIRVKGEAAFAAWDNLRRDFVWRSEKFEVLWDIVDGQRLKLNAVSVGGIERKAEG